MRTYVKKSKYWLFRKANRHSMKIWKSILILMGLVVLYALISRYVNRMPLISPLVSGPVQVKAKEPEVVIPCDDTPQHYLECKAYQKEITWEDHNKLFRIVNECENKSWDPNATNVNKHKDGSTSIDRGIFMINDRYHKKLTNEKAFDFKANIDYAIDLYKRSGINQWACARILNIK